jgi:nitrite reductase/ring-hydroxylating ferredoxin subunit
MSVLPPVRTRDPVLAEGRRLVAVADLPPSGVVEVETAEHGTLAVGIANGDPFAVSNVCRHQFAKLGQGWVDGDGCLVCPWHRAQYDVTNGIMVSGPKGRIFGFGPYSATVKGTANSAFRLHSYAVEERDGAIWLREDRPGSEQPQEVGTRALERD